MKIEVRLYATLARFSPSGSSGRTFTMELPEGAALYDLIEMLKLPREEVKLPFVNAVYQELSFVLQDGDEVGIFPPVGGGCA